MPGRIRLLYVIPGFGTGGTERLVADLVTHLDPNRFRVSVCGQHPGILGEALAGRGYPVHILADSINGRRSSIVEKVGALCGRVARLSAIMERERIDIIHTHYLGPLLHAFLARVGSRRWAWVHTEHNRPDVHVGHPRWLVRMWRWMLSSPDVITGVSDTVGEYFHENTTVLPGRVRVIYNGVDVDQFAGPYDRAGKRRELGIPPDGWVIGHVGNLRPEKNHELLLRAFASLLRSLQDAWLLLVGDGELRERLEALARDLGVADRVRFLGSRLDVPELFATFDVYCLPSRFEGMPLTVFEAMAARKPVIATSVVGIREIITDGETGLLVAPNDPDALTCALVRLRRHLALREKLTEAGWRYVNGRARLGDMVDQYAALYEKVLNSRKGIP